MSTHTGPFDFEETSDGFRITANGVRLRGGLLHGEVDEEIAYLKAELDELGRRMNVAGRERSAKAWRDASDA